MFNNLHTDRKKKEQFMQTVLKKKQKPLDNLSFFHIPK